jgi:hypothetical protein
MDWQSYSLGTLQADLHNHNAGVSRLRVLDGLPQTQGLRRGRNLRAATSQPIG